MPQLAPYSERRAAPRRTGGSILDRLDTKVPRRDSPSGGSGAGAFEGLADPKLKETNLSPALTRVEVASLPKFDSIIGYGSAKESMYTMMKGFVSLVQQRRSTDPRVKAEAAKYVQERLSGESLHGFLLYGPPGTGKTENANAFARETQIRLGSIPLTYYRLNAGVLKTALYGQTSAEYDKVFRTIKDGQKPVILFIDEAEAVFPRSGAHTHEETHNAVATAKELLGRIGQDPEILIVMATNHLDRMDQAIIRTGRLDDKILIGLPNEREKLAMLQHYKTKSGLPFDQDIEWRHIATQLKHGRASGADIRGFMKTIGREVASIEDAIQNGRLLVGVRRTVKGKNGDEEQDVLLQPPVHVNMPATIEEARNNADFDILDPASGATPEMLGLKITTTPGNPNRIKSVRVTHVTNMMVQWAMKKFDERSQTDLEGLRGK
jgi:hypothetical protein